MNNVRIKPAGLYRGSYRIKVDRRPWKKYLMLAAVKTTPNLGALKQVEPHTTVHTQTENL